MGDFNTDTCNIDCHCSKADYNPVCGINNVMYYSPCFAGCQDRLAGTDPQVCFKFTKFLLLSVHNGNVKTWCFIYQCKYWFEKNNLRS